VYLISFPPIVMACFDSTRSSTGTGGCEPVLEEVAWDPLLSVLILYSK
jgi:hypothetical protein